LSTSFIAAEPKFEPQPNKQQGDVEMAAPSLTVKEKRASPTTEKETAAAFDAATPKVQQAPEEAPPLQPSSSALGAPDAPVVMRDVAALPPVAVAVAADVTSEEARDGRTTAELKEELLWTASVPASEPSDTPMHLDDGAAALPPAAPAEEQRQPSGQQQDVEMTAVPPPVEKKRVDPAPAVQEAPKPPPAPVVSAPPVRKRKRYFVPEDREGTSSPPVSIVAPATAANAASVDAPAPAPVAIPAPTMSIAELDPSAHPAPAASVAVVPQELLPAPSYSPAAAVLVAEPEAKMPATKDTTMPVSDEVATTAAVAPEVSHAADLQQEFVALRPSRRVFVAPTAEFFDVYDALQELLAPLWESLVSARLLTRDQTALAHWIEPFKVNKLLYAKYRHIMSGTKTNNTNGQWQTITLAFASHDERGENSYSHAAVIFAMLLNQMRRCARRLRAIVICSCSTTARASLTSC